MRALAFMAAVIMAVQAAMGFVIYLGFDSWDERGTFGDMFGAVNALFSGLALAGVIYTILLQRHELALQRKELELTREELARSADAQAAQTQLQMQQHARVYAQNSLAAVQDAASFPALKIVDEMINRRIQPKSQSIGADFLRDFDVFMRNHYAVVALTLGLNSLEVRGLLKLHDIVQTAWRENEWKGIEPFQAEQSSINDLFERVQVRLMEKLEREMYEFELLFARSKV